jgi:addiction module HigA family antidote
LIKEMRMTSAVRTTINAPSVDELREPPTHPGEMLLEEFLRPQQVTQVEAAKHLRISTTRLNEIIRGKRGITADTAWRLSDWLGTGPDVWMNLQSKWDLWQARRVRRSA